MGCFKFKSSYVGCVVVIRKTIKPSTYLVFLILAVFLLQACSDKTTQLEKGKPTPRFELTKLNGGSVHFPEDTLGKVITLCFWADWCPYCKTELRDIEPIYQKYKNKGLIILAINLRQDNEKAAAFLSDIKISYDVLLDKAGKVADDYGVSGLPITFVIDRKGNLHTQILGESSPEVFESIIKELL